MGRWMQVNSEAIYGTTASPFATELPWGRATQKPGRIYLEVFDWPANGTLSVPPVAGTVNAAHLLAAPGAPLSVRQTAAGLTITVPAQVPDPVASVVALDVAGQ